MLKIKKLSKDACLSLPGKEAFIIGEKFTQGKGRYKREKTKYEAVVIGENKCKKTIDYLQAFMETVKNEANERYEDEACAADAIRYLGLEVESGETQVGTTCVIRVPVYWNSDLKPEAVSFELVYGKSSAYFNPIDLKKELSSLSDSVQRYQKLKEKNKPIKKKKPKKQIPPEDKLTLTDSPYVHSNDTQDVSDRDEEDTEA